MTIYLAVPYSHREEGVRHIRAEHATRTMARLIGEGHIVFCPVVMYHNVDVILKNKGKSPSLERWLEITDKFVDMCDRLVVLQLPNWEESAGVAHEIEKFAERGIEPEFVQVEQR